MKRSRVLTITVATVIALAGAAALAVFWEKDMPHPANEERISVHFRGLGLNDSTGFLGRKWTGISLRYLDGSHYRVDYEAPGYNAFAGYYPDGSRREVGTCMVWVLEVDTTMPYPDFSDVEESRCYKPDGTLGSEVRDGTGVQTIWNPDGTKVSEQHLEKHVRTLQRNWHDNGQLSVELRYEEGSVHGPFTSFHPNGQVHMTGEHRLGFRVGVWTTYAPDGTVTEIKDYGAPNGE